MGTRRIVLDKDRVVLKTIRLPSQSDFSAHNKMRIDIILSFTHDDQFGLVVVFGSGGIFVEVLKDVCFRVAPLTRYDATRMIQQIKGYEILAAARNRKEADVDAIIDGLLRISRLAMETSEHFRELDLNPVYVFEKGRGIKVVDYLFVKNSPPYSK